MLMAKTLFLTPTRYERDLLFQNGLQSLEIELCGFGLVEAAVNTSDLIARHQPEQIALIGLAGVYSAHTDCIGSAQCFQSVTTWGIGACRQEKILSGIELGFVDAELETLELSYPGSLKPLNQLVSVGLAGFFSEADILARFVQADGEDMEGYAVARAARLSSTPVTILRGISNRVGQPIEEWEIEKSISALAQMVRDLIDDGSL